MAHPDVVQAAGHDPATDGIRQSEVRVPHHAEHMRHPPVDHGLDHDIRDRALLRPGRRQSYVDAVAANFAGEGFGTLAPVR